MRIGRAFFSDVTVVMTPDFVSTLNACKPIANADVICQHGALACQKYNSNGASYKMMASAVGSASYDGAHDARLRRAWAAWVVWRQLYFFNARRARCRRRVAAAPPQRTAVSEALTVEYPGGDMCPNAGTNVYRKVVISYACGDVRADRGLIVARGLATRSGSQSVRGNGHARVRVTCVRALLRHSSPRAHRARTTSIGPARPGAAKSRRLRKRGLAAIRPADHCPRAVRFCARRGALTPFVVCTFAARASGEGGRERDDTVVGAPTFLSSTAIFCFSFLAVSSLTLARQ